MTTPIELQHARSPLKIQDVGQKLYEIAEALCEHGETHGELYDAVVRWKASSVASRSKYNNRDLARQLACALVVAVEKAE